MRDFIKICILVAGFGSRLGKGIPKAIVNVTMDHNILDLQIENLKLLDINLKDIILVVGYKKELIIERYPELSFVYNEDYKNNCTAKSLLKGIEAIENDDVLWMNGDIVFDRDIINLLIKNKDQNIVLVDNKHTRQEEIKYNVDSDGFVKEVSKNVKNSMGELIGINLVKKYTLPTLIRNLQISDELDYFDTAIQKTINNGFKFRPINIQDKFSIQIDYPYELETAKRWVKKNLFIQHK